MAEAPLGQGRKAVFRLARVQQLRERTISINLR